MAHESPYALILCPLELELLNEVPEHMAQESPPIASSTAFGSSSMKFLSTWLRNIDFEHVSAEGELPQ